MAQIIFSWRGDPEHNELRHGIVEVRRPDGVYNDMNRLSVTIYERYSLGGTFPIGDSIALFGLSAEEIIQMGEDLQLLGQHFLPVTEEGRPEEIISAD